MIWSIVDFIQNRWNFSNKIHAWFQNINQFSQAHIILQTATQNSSMFANVCDVSIMLQQTSQQFMLSPTQSRMKDLFIIYNKIPKDDAKSNKEDYAEIADSR